MNNCLEAVHMRFLQNVLGVGNKVSHDVVREEPSLPLTLGYFGVSEMECAKGGCRHHGTCGLKT